MYDKHKAALFQKVATQLSNNPNLPKYHLDTQNTYLETCMLAVVIRVWFQVVTKLCQKIYHCRKSFDKL